MRPKIYITIALGMLVVTGSSHAAPFGVLKEILTWVGRKIQPEPAPDPQRVKPPEPRKDGPPAVHPNPGAKLPHDATIIKSNEEVKARESLLRNVASVFGVQYSKAFPKLLLVHKNAKTFGSDFLRGTKDPEQHLTKLQDTNPLVRPWRATARLKRVFVVGAAESEPDVLTLRNELRSQGYEVFFYQFCRHATKNLCTSEEVGAFYASAGHVVTFGSPDFSKSDYIAVETAAIYKHTTGGIILVFSPDDVYRASVVGGSVTVPAYSTAPSQDRQKTGKTGSRRVPATDAAAVRP